MARKASPWKASKPASKVDTGRKGKHATTKSRYKDPSTPEGSERIYKENRTLARARAAGRVRQTYVDKVNEKAMGLKKRKPTPTKPRAKKK